MLLAYLQPSIHYILLLLQCNDVRYGYGGVPSYFVILLIHNITWEITLLHNIMWEIKFVVYVENYSVVIIMLN